MSEQKDGVLVKGIVVSSFRDDPDNAGRLQVYIPSVHGAFDDKRVGVNPPTNEENEDTQFSYMYPWAQCVTMMGVYSVPKVGANVWIMYEANNPRLPVIIGMHTAGLNLNDDENFNSSEQGTGIAGGTLAEIAAQVIFGNEGGYTSVNWNDNGAISIGKIQWHANNARDLLVKIRDKNSAKFSSVAPTVAAYLGQSWNNLKNWSKNCIQGQQLLAILDSEESKQVQDDEAIAYVQVYIDNIQKNGVTNPQSIIYLADIANQGPAIGYAFAKYSASNGADNLDKVHANTLAHKPYASKYINVDSPYVNRRRNTYNKIKELEQQGTFTENGLTNMAGSSGSGEVGWPIPGNGTITSPFGNRLHPIKKVWKLHNGIDIGAPNGTKIYCAVDGTVEVNQFNDGGYGWYVVVKGSKYVTLYAHMNKQSSMRVGSKVRRGDFVGNVGSTGASTGNHLHFTVGMASSYSSVGSLNSTGCAIDPLKVAQKP